MRGRRLLLAPMVVLSTGAAITMAIWEARFYADAPLSEQLAHIAEAGVAWSWAMTGAVLAWLRPRNRLGWILLVGGCVIQLGGTLVSAENYFQLFVYPDVYTPRPILIVLLEALWITASYAVPSVLPALYPSGRLLSRRWGWLIAVTIFGAVAGAVLNVANELLGRGPPTEATADSTSYGPAYPIWLAILALVLFLGGTVAVWIGSGVRLVRAQYPERQQVAWVLFAVMALTVVPWAVILFGPGLTATGATVANWAAVLCWYLLPVAVGVGVFRYRLLGIEWIIRRGLVFGTLTMLILMLQAAVSAAAGAGIAGEGTGVVAAGLVAVGLSPVRDRLQRWVDRLLYGQRADPLRAVTELGGRVAVTSEQGLLEAVLDGVRGAVLAAGASIRARDRRVLASNGATEPELVFPLEISGNTLGVLEVAARRPGEKYGRNDRKLLAAMAPLVAVVLRAVLLADALRAQRDRVVEATRHERERLRRDLHDGLGPALTGVGLGLQAVEDSLGQRELARAEELTLVLRGEVSSAVVEIRRVLEDLRPALLAREGLAGAVTTWAKSVNTKVDLTVRVGQLPRVPEEVERAAYRIVQEAVNNIVKHADATQGRVELDSVEGHLRVCVSDDGQDAAFRAGAGIGLDSMRQRAEEVGGTLTITSGEGTAVVALLPLHQTRDE